VLGAAIGGPAILEQQDATIMVEPELQAHVDRFGNIITDLVAPKAANRIALTVRGKTITNSAETYESGRRFQGPFLITGSRGTLEISIAGGSAATELQIARLDPVEMQQKS